MNTDVKIANCVVGIGHPPFIIAELSGNHNGSLERALKIVDAAAEAGVDAIKLQTYTADTMTLDIKHPDFLINDKESLWRGKTLYQLYKEAYTPWEWHPIIMERANKHGLICFSSPFDETAVDFLETLNVPAYKVASFECIDTPLIQHISKTGKPVIISTGMAEKSEIYDAVNAAKSYSSVDVILLKCTSTYPAEPSDSNLNTLEDLSKSFSCQVGLSDHTLGIGAALTSIGLGARVIEKHFTLSRADGGVDAAFSLEPDEMKMLVTEAKSSFLALGETKYGPSGHNEMKSMMGRRSIYFIRDLAAGSIVTQSDIARIRPANGLEPRYLNRVLGCKTTKTVKRGTPVTWDLLDTA